MNNTFAKQVSKLAKSVYNKVENHLNIMLIK